MSDALLKTRQETHGDAWVTAVAYCQSDPLKYPLDMIHAKLARIYSGDATHEDHWRDIAGYAHMALMFLQRGRHE